MEKSGDLGRAKILDGIVNKIKEVKSNDQILNRQISQDRKISKHTTPLP